MLASVTRLQPRVGSFETALTAYRAASLKYCLAQLVNLSSPRVATLKARAYLRLGDPVSAASSLRHTEGSSASCRGEIALLFAVALRRTGDRENSDVALRDATVFAISAADASLLSEVEFYTALFAVGDGDLETAKEALERGLAASQGHWGSGSSDQYIPRAHVLSRIQELLGITEVARGAYGKQLPHARAALETLEASEIRDVYQEAFALRNLSILTRDFDIDDDAVELFDRVRNFAYTDDISHVEFTTCEALAWSAALRGDAVGALRQIRVADRVATSVPERVLLGVDRALLARNAGHDAMVCEEIEYAFDLAEGYDWNESTGDFRDALLALAQIAASTSPSKARTVLNRYTSITRSMDIAYAARIEPRARAEEDYTHGVVLRSEGRLGASMERLESAFKTWDSIGYAWRAGRAALELAELDAGEVFRLAVRRELNRRPESPFAKRARLVA